MAPVNKTNALLFKQLAEDIATLAHAQTGSGIDREAIEKLITNHLANRLRVGCQACSDEGFYSTKLHTLKEVLDRIKNHAGKLWADGQENEARYLRDFVGSELRTEIGEVKLKWDALDKLNLIHTCTLTGEKP